MTKSCVLAQHGLSVETDGTLQPCCQFRGKQHEGHLIHTFLEYSQWREEINQLAQDLDRGIEDPRCQQCWHDEKLGYDSLRTVSNRRHRADNSNTDPWHVEFKLGNFCNLKCIMCSPYSSSSIWSEYLQNKTAYQSVNIAWKPNAMEQKWWATPEFAEFSEKILSSVTYLHFTGGEPFMVPGLENMLRAVPNPAQVDLLFVTNLTMINDSTLELIKQFRSVNFVISLEGTGDKNDYVRFGSDFMLIEQNLKKIKHILTDKLILGVNHTFQHTSIYCLPELIDWCHAHNLHLHFSSHGGEEYMRINSVPSTDVEQFESWLAQSTALDPDVKSYIVNALADYQYSAELNARFRQYTNMLDSIRGNNFDLTFAPSLSQ
jgi:radical SAM protein with 4Fe4S-binding SPASM domain